MGECCSGLVNCWKFVLQVVIDWAGRSIRTINSWISWQFWWQQESRGGSDLWCQLIILISTNKIRSCSCSCCTKTSAPTAEWLFSCDERERYDKQASFGPFDNKLYRREVKGRQKDCVGRPTQQDSVSAQSVLLTQGNWYPCRRLLRTAFCRDEDEWRKNN